MKANRKSVLALVGVMAVGAAMAAPSVEIVSVQQQYPWTNTVDIVYNVAGVASDTNGYFVAFTPTTQDGLPIEDINGETSIQVALSCTTNGAVAQWFPQTNQQYTACKMTPAVYRGGSASGKDYMIVDLDTGAVTYEPMATQAASNERYQADAYKTRYLVLRRVPADTYWIGGPETTAIGLSGYTIGPNSYHKVEIPQDFYYGIYELTEAQYSRIMGEAITNSKLAKGWLTWNGLRGSALPAAVPTSGVFARLNARTGLRGFDMPTESMWEIASRAGCKDKFLSGDTETGLTDYGWFSDNGKKRHEVGVAKKGGNGWGIYDVLGNEWEFCRDAVNSDDLAKLQPNGLVPVASGVAGRCRVCGGAFDWPSTSGGSRLSGRSWGPRAQTYEAYGVRVSYFPQ